MMKAINRREFLKYCISAAGTIGLSSMVVGKLSEALASGGGNLPAVIWLSGASCTGCTVSLANRISASGPVMDVADLFANYIDLKYHPNLMGSAGETAVDNIYDVMAGGFVLAFEGGIPTAYGGHACTLWEKDGVEMTAYDAVNMLAPNSIANLAIGTCASFGGIPKGNPNPTGIMSLSQATGRPTINIPGCPAHPDWIVWTVAQLLSGIIPTLDSYSRPYDLFGGESKIVHQQCPRRGTDETEAFGRDGYCMKELGCRGPSTKGDCPVRKWNNGTNWCIGANSVCTGCTERGFPDSFSPFFRAGGD
jgi:hydrogenase small subunit